MDRGLPIGRACGVPLTMHWSVLVILWLFTWSLASALPRTVGGYASIVYWSAGLVGAVLLLTCLLAHEMTHVIVARRSGEAVKGVHLWLLGGVARLGGEPKSPREAFWVAASGPLTSFAMVAVCASTATILRILGAPDIAIAVSWWLAGANWVIALFNLLPAAPLDGGRVLRAVLWHWQRDATRSAVIAARVGQAVAALIIAVGLVEMYVGIVVTGLWLLFIGFFLFDAAREEEWWLLSCRVLADVSVADVMTGDPHVVPGDITLDDFIERHLLGDRHSAYPVVTRDGELSGLVTLSQVRDVSVGDRRNTMVDDVALSRDRLVFAKPDEQLSALSERLKDSRSERALVFDAGTLVGIVTSKDVARLMDVGQLSLPHSAAGRVHPMFVRR